MRLGERERERLQIIVAQHQRRDLVGHVEQQRVALARTSARRSRIGLASAILILTSTSEVLTPAELSIASVLSRTPVMRRLDAAALGHAEIGALADHLAVQIRADDADRVIGAVADLVVGLARSAHIGADAAEEQQIGLAS